MEARRSLKLGPCHHVKIMITGSLSPVCWCRWSLPGTLEDGWAGGWGEPVPRRALFADTLLFWGGKGQKKRSWIQYPRKLCENQSFFVRHYVFCVFYLKITISMKLSSITPYWCKSIHLKCWHKVTLIKTILMLLIGYTVYLLWYLNFSQLLWLFYTLSWLAWQFLLGPSQIVIIWQWYAADSWITKSTLRQDER